MSILSKIKPSFWAHEHAPREPYKHLFNFQLIWKKTVIVFSLVAIIPLVITALFGYRVHRFSTEAELMRSSARLVSNVSQSISMFMEVYRTAVNLAIHENNIEDLSNDEYLKTVLKNLQQHHDEFKGLALLNASGRQKAFAGSFDLTPHHSEQLLTIHNIKKQISHTSEVYTASNGALHLKYTAGRRLSDGTLYLLRTAIHTGKLNQLVDQLASDPSEDIFIINQNGILQTPSRFYGRALDSIDLTVPIATEDASVSVTNDLSGNRLIVGQALIPQTPFRLMTLKPLKAAEQSWYKTPHAFTVILILSVFVILAVTIALAMWLVDQIHEADQERLRALHQVEQTSKMASIGRLAAGVAHEINNPLAIINEKAGHIKDIFSIDDTSQENPKLLELVDAIITSVERSSTVTKQLLDFAGHLNASIEKIDLVEIINEVHRVLGKEPELKCITVRINVAADLPHFEGDRGRLEQIFYNLFNYSVSKMNEGGQLEITAEQKDKEYITVILSDTGPGIPETELMGIFEPFSTFRTDTSGTNLSIAITYALVQQIGGHISIDNQIGIGTQFKIRIPIELTEPIR